jgi:hypothetical protein
MEGLTTSGAPAFPRWDASAFAALARQYAALKQRRVTEVHLHHTWVPNYSHYRDLKDQLGSGEAAGREQCRRMRLSHMRDRGFSDIAQHVTIDPEGRIWLCRAWTRAPASAVGFNGNSVAGPFMIEMVGDFDQGKDAMSSAQREAALSVVDGMQRAFGLAPSALRFHREMAEKSCPGTTNRKAEWIEELTGAASGGRLAARRMANCRCPRTSWRANRLTPTGSSRPWSG